MSFDETPFPLTAKLVRQHTRLFNGDLIAQSDSSSSSEKFSYLNYISSSHSSVQGDANEDQTSYIDSSGIETVRAPTGQWSGRVEGFAVPQQQPDELEEGEIRENDPNSPYNPELQYEPYQSQACKTAMDYNSIVSGLSPEDSIVSSLDFMRSNCDFGVDRTCYMHYMMR